MPVIQTSLQIHAPIERIFDLSRSIDLHIASTAHTGERAVAGVTSGLISLGEEVTWRARHFGIWQELTSRISQYNRPHHFRDSLVRGAFRHFDHDHYFETDGAITTMKDVFDFESPFGILGLVVNHLVLERYMRRLLEKRNEVIKEVAESEKWRTYLL
ncbi:SRPBCC family protein [Pedosphaera parvula]|uniref:SRPBCC family protein n=1 Tax=Pedosphaera parvula TaxID=1032527 RepID=UPI0001735D8C|nr:SRPBCC family protein [Pedosphaera parvula]